MLTTFGIKMFVGVMNGLLSIFPAVTTLPAIFGYDLDGSLTTGVGMLYNFATVVWPVGVVLSGFLVLMGYYSAKMLLRLIIGSRAPGAYN